MDSTLITSIYSALVAFCACIILCPITIPWLARLKFGQVVRDDGPSTHAVKQGTPTMGGIVIIVSLIAGAVFFARGNNDALSVLLVTAGFGLVGFVDDWLKVVRKNPKGLKPKLKLAAQLLISIGFILYLHFSGQLDGWSAYIPFGNGASINFGYLTVPFIIFAMLGFVNGVNLTDGLDGLSSGVTALVVMFMFFVSYSVGSVIGNTGLAYVNGAAVGALLGFLLFNSHPARVFMGDTGSLALGGLVSAMAIILKMPLVTVLVGIIFLLESLSSMIQTGWFKYTRIRFGQGRRVFKMAPLHHHFELSGMKETRVVSMFYIVTAVMCLIGFIAVRGIV